MKTFTFEKLERQGASSELLTRLNYAIEMIRRMQSADSTVGRLFAERDGH